ncbi:type III PLP-dependent enzyme [Parasphingorhabdus halotolerans]|uniref:ornithine decarboxylase n=1 Tax=Parasphingorhabdus halotolerans TaxID=2725558 RepID=A0A6H2DJZ0_9SPHN|nr:type III PLP-dependent enzyme [Parasphingorhabdus halotolerans]QJB68303.1 type III PLP-dependent enzyme [Parasphingorhabdus halotolerans]
MHIFQNAGELAKALSPDIPVLLNRPHAARRAARYFVEQFPGKSLYAVKANPSPELLEILWDSGITHFDVASIDEVRLVRRVLPEAVLCYMNPLKQEQSIREAYHEHGVRIFSLDGIEELDKIERATGNAEDLTLCVRIRVASEFAEISLASKFGVDVADSAELLQRARQSADELGICFHVGSQAMSPLAFVHALERVRTAIVEASVTVDIVNVGGGFPSIYPDMEPQSLNHYFKAIDRTFEDLPISYSAELWCEPGRALAAEYTSLLVKVEKRRSNELYINDGAYGTLFDAAHIGWRFPAQIVGRQTESTMAEFSFYGPTCDDMDYMAGPFILPDDMKAGDYIEIGMLGAYGSAMRTKFNGYGSHVEYDMQDEPMDSLYLGDNLDRNDRENVVSFPGA